ncbi:AmmeMemoRadiSam system radical SAM enzyme [candidate division KSB1 bacterium 4572_119]|nr:MAG: AmmeMemoRadiSam system radical SAM enzyme [candidate division KSB1 bacterium 4572_119]
MKEGLFFTKLENNEVRCELCPHLCRLKNGQTGICHIRKNIGGILYSSVFGKAIASHIDPIEKKPLFHVAPGSASFSVATAGCNFNCQFCQNHDISQVKNIADIENYGREMPPEKIVENAALHHCQSIAYTYTEPTIYFEYAYETAKLARKKNILNVFVTNGYINPEPLKLISPFLDAANVDLKSFHENFYRKLVGGKLAPVLETLKLMKEFNIWIEVTTLIIPGENDSTNELEQLARFIKNELGEETPWHISRFYPQYKLSNYPPTPITTLERAFAIGKDAGLYHVYMGNVPGNETESTFCFNCNKMLIRRHGYQIVNMEIDEGKCKFCGAECYGIRM